MKHKTSKEEQSMRRAFEKSVNTVMAAALMAALAMNAFLVQPAQAANLVAGTFAELAAAITNANDEVNYPGADTITLTAEITLAAALPNVTSEIIVEGEGYALDGGHTYNHFYVVESGDFTVKNLTLKNGNSGYGGSITNRGTLTVLNCTFQDNTGGNSATSGGGAIFNHGKTGGQPTATTNITNSTFSNNSGGLGGAILNWQASTGAVVTIAYSTFSGNSGTYGGADIHSWVGHVNLETSILADVSSGNHCGFTSGSLSDNGYNLVEDATCGSIPAGADPMLGALQDNGGPTWTQALSTGSPAIDVIPNASNGCGTTVTVDQRGETRPSPDAGSCDIGAFEWEYPFTLYLPLILR
ncbi:MAG: hypothetical protein NTU91_13180 [Chloroflexi bacterium]|nr:hypothetical protein [Chloroflexota bacterium]